MRRLSAACQPPLMFTSSRLRQPLQRPATVHDRTEGKGDIFYSKYAEGRGDADDVLLPGGNVRRPASVIRSCKPLSRFLRQNRWWIIPTVVLNFVYVWGVYGYATTAAYPVPRSTLNWTEGRWQTFNANSSLFIFITACWDACAVVFALMETRLWLSASGKMQWFIGGVIMTLFGVVLLTAALADQIAAALLSAQSYKRYCDNDWLQVEFVAHLSYNSTSRNIATFSLVETGETLFTFTSSDPDPETFALAALNSSQPTILPSLRSVRFDESAETLTGECFKPEGVPCGLSGSVKSTSGLSFKLTLSGSRPLTTSLRNIYSDWSINKLPQVILHLNRQDAEDQEGPLLFTSVAMPRRCDRQKVCVTHAQKSDVLGPETIVPTAWLLQRFSEYAVWCSTPQQYSGV